MLSNKKQIFLGLFCLGLNLNVESKIDLKKIANEVKRKIQKAPAKAAAIALGTIGTVAGIASIISNKTKPEELTYFHDKLFNTIAETNVEEKVNEFKTLSKAQRELKLGDVLLFEVNETQSQEDLKKKLVKITCKHEQDKDKKDLYLYLKTKMIVQLKEGKPVPMNFAKDTEPKKTYVVKTLSELADPITPSNSTHWSRNKNRYFVAGGVLTTAAVCAGAEYHFNGKLDSYTASALERLTHWKAKAAEAARVEAADKMKKDLDTECLRNGKDSNTCLQAHKELAKLCPAGSTNLSCENAHENLANTKALVALEETRYQACSVDSNSLKCLEAIQAQACFAGTIDSTGKINKECTKAIINTGTATCPFIYPKTTPATCSATDAPPIIYPTCSASDAATAGNGDA